MPDRTRVAAYGICIDADRVLLTRFVHAGRGERHWTLPGGGLEPGEDPFDAVAREFEEETGHTVAVQRLLGIDARTIERVEGGLLHHVGVFYEVRVTGGALRDEVGGSTDLAEWVPLDGVADRERAVIVEVGLALARTRPADGHVPAVEVAGLLRA
ncbi:MAG: NUDIX domain-containing protein [Hamadaea sp.]|nr:NUDIX domain-containing protein [Hamadaea sp.]